MKNSDKAKEIASIFIVLFIVFVVIFIIINTATFQRAFKTVRSDVQGGVPRVVTVYDSDGNKVAKYRGKIDLEYGDNKILWEDEDGLRHQIFLGGGFVIVDEVKE